MIITDELRRWVGIYEHEVDYMLTSRQATQLLKIADRIDAEHERMYADLTIGMEPMDEEHMARDGWVKLPVDADGVPIHVGDELTNGENMSAKVRVLMLAGDGWWCKSGESTHGCISPSKLRHVQSDSWESIIADAAKLARGDNAAVMELVERCRRLAGEAE